MIPEIHLLEHSHLESEQLIELIAQTQTEL